MERKVVSAGKKPKAGELHRITIEKAGNGFSIRKHRKPSPENRMMGMHDEDEPQVFTKHPAAKAHIAAALQEMHPSLPPAGAAPDAGAAPPAAGAPAPEPDEAE